MRPLPNRPLPPLPDQPAGVPWPTEAWPTAEPTEAGADAGRVRGLLDELFDESARPDIGRTFGAAVVAGGRLVAERYGRRVVPDLAALGDSPNYEDLDEASPLLSWSMAKSITSLAVGSAVGAGELDLADPVPEPLWAGPDDPRSHIGWRDLLAMRPGLAWKEAYYDLDGDRLPDVVTMLFGDGAADVAGYAASFPLQDPPGSDAAYRYSSGTTNIVSANLQRTLDLDAPAMDRFLHERIFDPVGMASATAEFDPAGTFIGSSYVRATLRDWARFGLLAARGGRWDGREIVPGDWMDVARTPRSWESDDVFHGAHWWAWDRPDSPFGAHGFEGQRVIVFPARDVVVVRLGWIGENDAAALNDHLAAVAACFPEVA